MSTGRFRPCNASRFFTYATRRIAPSILLKALPVFTGTRQFAYLRRHKMSMAFAYAYQLSKYCYDDVNALY